MEDETDSCGAKRLNKAMSPGSMTLPTMNNWDMSQAMSPYIPPDMNSIASGSMMNGPPSYSGRNNQYEFGSGGNQGSGEYSQGNGPLSHLSESVNSLDPLNAMEKSLNEQVGCNFECFVCFGLFWSLISLINGIEVLYQLYFWNQFILNYSMWQFSWVSMNWII